MTLLRLSTFAALTAFLTALASCGGGGGGGSGTTTGDAPSAIAVPTTSASFSATTDDFPNPERGFYSGAGTDFATAFDVLSVRDSYSRGYRLVVAKINLASYRTSDLPATWLADLSKNFAAVRKEGIKVTLLFGYDFSAAGNDATAAQIKRHLEQLQPVLQEHADIIPYMRAGFIGAWGEWHSSKAGNSCIFNSGTTSCTTADANRLIVRDALLANVPATTQIGFRSPKDLQAWYPSPTQQSRAGLHNDAFLSNDTDSGTYLAPADRPYIQALSAHTALGGETLQGDSTARNTCADIQAEGLQYHLAWLNADYDPLILNAWKAGGCYSQVSRSLGYRLQLDSVTHPQTAARGSSTAVQLGLRNIGWARLFSARPLVVTLVHSTSGASITASGGNLQTLPAQASSTTPITVSVAIPAAAQPGDYDLVVSAPDIYTTTATDARFSVRFANADNSAQQQVWNPVNAAFRLGTRLNVQ
jgi:hypothetical protein